MSDKQQTTIKAALRPLPELRRDLRRAWARLRELEAVLADKAEQLKSAKKVWRGAAENVRSLEDQILEWGDDA